MSGPSRPAGPPVPTPAGNRFSPRTPPRGAGATEVTHGHGPEPSSDDSEMERIERLFDTPSPDRSDRSRPAEREPRRRRARTRSARPRPGAAPKTAAAKASVTAKAPPVPPDVGPQNVDLQFFYNDYREYRRWSVIEQNNLRNSMERAAGMICSPEERCNEPLQSTAGTM
eukprot:s339_g8.t1